MGTVSAILPCYAADTAGVCSALYELGGMTVVHDASGCNSTYATHDEPRWTEMQSDIYISALTELDAILGNDEKFIADVTAAARDRKPAFIALCTSPMPVMTGTDMEAAAAEIEARTGIFTFSVPTDGMHDYLCGAAAAWTRLLAAYAEERPKAAGTGVNLLGLTPLDFGLGGTAEHLRAWLTENGFVPVSCLAMGESALRDAAAAQVSLVVSQTGLPAAEYLRSRFGIPYVCGLPVRGLSETVAAALRRAASDGQCACPCALRSGARRTVVIGEGITSGSFAAATGAAVLHPLPCAASCADPADLHIADEAGIAAALREMQPETVIADPLYRYVLPEGTMLLPLPHYAFSGRCFDRAIPDFLRFSCESGQGAHI